MTHHERYFVVGTDTGVGKTVLSLILMRHFYGKGVIPFYIKPFQTGCKDPYDQDSDAKFIYGHVKELQGKDPAESVIHCFKNPKAPYFAARDEGIEKGINISYVREFVDRKAMNYSPLIIEAAGGLLVPLDETNLMIDLIPLTAAKPILAARAGLGTINHTLLSIEILRSRGIDPLTVIFLDSSETPTPPNMIQENIEAVEKYSGVRVGAVINRIENFDNPDDLMGDSGLDQCI